MSCLFLLHPTVFIEEQGIKRTKMAWIENKIKEIDCKEGGEDEK